MNPAIALIGIPVVLAVLWSAATIASYRANPLGTRGESRRQQELLDRAVELRGEVPDEFWPHVAPPSNRAARSSTTASVR